MVAWREPIYRYVRRIVRDASVAEDLTQETFLRAHDKASSLADPARLGPWLYRIATNVCYDHFRKASRPDSPQSLDAQDHAGEQAIAADQPRLDQVMEQQEMSACVQQYFAHLPDAYRAVLLLHDVEGLTNPEIAEMLAISLATVKIRLHRARSKLRAALNEACVFSADHRGVLVCQPKLVNIKP